MCVYVRQCMCKCAPVCVRTCAHPPPGWGQEAYLFCIRLEAAGTEYESSVYGQNILLCGSECVRLAQEMWCPEEEPLYPGLPPGRAVSA